MKKIFILLTSTIFSLSQLQSLELTGISSSLPDIFESFTDDNEGLTTFRSMNIPSGGRTEALGTAFTGLCDDISFFDYNPAASSMLEKTQLAVSHNSWIADSAMETLTIARRNANFGYGAQIKCFYVPFSEYNLFGDKVSGSYYSETSAAINMSYNFLAGYTFKGIALGFNAKAAWRNIPDYTDNKTDEIITGSGLEQSALGIMADGGLLMSFNFLKNFSGRAPNLRFGLALNNFGISLTGYGKQLKKDDSIASRLSAGFSYRPLSHILFTAEIRQPVDIFNITTIGQFSAASGFEIKVTDHFAMETGLLIQGGNPRISLGSEFEIFSVKLNVCYTLDLTSSFTPVNHISLGAKLNFTDRGRKLALEKVDRIYTDGLELYADGNYTDAIIKWNEAIKLAKQSPLRIRYEPAIDARDIAITFNRNQRSLENIQNLSEE